MILIITPFVILISFIMDKMISKKGRPKSTVVTKAILRRVPEDLVEVVDRYLDAAIKARHEANCKAIDEWLKREYGWKRPEPSLNEPQSKEAHEAVNYLTEISELKAQNLALADNVAGLTRELDEARNALTDMVNGDNSEVVAGLRFRIKELEGKVKIYEQERHG